MTEPGSEGYAPTFALRYVYAMLAIIAVAAAVVIGSLYLGQQDETRTRDRIQFFNLESVTESEELIREVQTLLVVYRDQPRMPTSGHIGAAGIRSMQLGHSGLLSAMRSRLERISALHEQHESTRFNSAVARLVDRFERVESMLESPEVTLETIISIEVLGSTVEQFDRLHKLAATEELHALADRQGRRPGFLALLVACLAFSALAAWYLTRSLRISLLRQKKVELALAESQERLHHIQKLDALGRLTGGVAHDFNNLLTAILGHTELLQDKAIANKRLTTGLNEIRQASLQAASLTQQLLAFSRKQQFKPRVVVLNELIQDMEEMLQRIIGSDIAMTFSYANELHAVELDPDQMQQVIMNLVSNARDAMPDGGTLSFTTENVAVGKEDSGGIPGGEYAMLTVADNGTGMNQHTLERLFEPFFTTKEEGSGTGLGLSTVHGIVHGSNGHIVVDSELDRGSKFYLYFPCTEVLPEEAANESMPKAPQKGSETVLVVEDDEQILQLLEIGLSSLGYRVLTAPGGAAGLQICRTFSGPIDVIVSDIVMPEINGPRFMASALKLRPDAVAIYVSAYSEDAVLQFRRKSSGSEIPLLTKPFELGSLSQLIRERLASNVAAT